MEMFVIAVFSVWFLSLIAYQPSRVIYCQSHPYKRTVAVLFNPYFEDKVVHTFCKDVSTKVNAMTQMEFDLAYRQVL